MKKTVVVINEHASRVKKRKRALQALFKLEEFAHVEVIYVKDPKNFHRAIKRALTKKPDILVFGGGDGTIIGGISYALKQDYGRSFAMLPLGTSNYLARNLDIPLRAKEAMQAIASGKSHALHFGTANGKLFSLMATVGITTSVSEHVSVESKQKIGQAAYLVETFRQLFKQDSFEYEITLPKRKKTYRGESHQLAVINADVSKQLKFVPDSNLKDPRLRITMYTSGKKRYKVVLSVLIYLLTIGRVKKGQVDIYTKEAIIKTTPRQTVAVDGEVLTKTPVNVAILPKKVKIVY